MKANLWIFHGSKLSFYFNRDWFDRKDSIH